MHQIAFGGWALPRPAGGAYSAYLGPLAGLRGAYFYGKVYGKGVERQERGRHGREREKRRGEEGPLLVWILDTPLAVSYFR